MNDEVAAPYGTGPETASGTAPGTVAVKRVRTHHLRRFKESGARFSMLTAYDQNTAAIFAFTALSMLPALAFFVLAQRRIVGGLSGLAGSIKG